MENKISPEKTILKVKTILSSIVDNDTLLLSIENSKYYSMPSVSGRIWQLLEENPWKVSELIIKLQEEYDVDSATCTNDVIEFLQHLLNNGLIEINQQ